MGKKGQGMGSGGTPSNQRANQQRSPLKGRRWPHEEAEAAQSNPAQASATESSSTRDNTGSGSQQNSSQQKIMITGDDILIEYVTRLMKTFSSNKIREENLTGEQQSKIEKFITHYVWYAQDKGDKSAAANDKKGMGLQQGSLKIRLENRLNEMLERRRRLLKMLFKNEGRLNVFHEQYPDIVKRKKEVIEKFDSKELEHLLSNSTKNVAQEVVGCLIPGKGKGILNEIEQTINN